MTDPEPKTNTPLIAIRRRRRLRIAAGCVIFGLAGLLLIGWMHDSVLQGGDNRLYTTGTCPARRVCIVFGSRVYADGRVSYPLAVRLQCAVELYKTGKAKKILVSGDNSKSHYNEVEVMQAWLEKRGIPADAIDRDHAGFRTLDTCARAARVWKLKEPVLLVTQKYHLPRALYLADAWGLDAVGVCADGLDSGTARKRDKVREFLARVLAWLDVNILDRQPKFFGSPEVI